ncbi:peptidoglycan-binding protein [Planktotalea sp.]|uniref:peptidoglycan-binding protein n=1 Tax=Planktotalea sp. TaxID=2029877 RepID=UPI003D6BF0F4
MLVKKWTSFAFSALFAVIAQTSFAQEQCETFDGSTGDWEICQDYGVDPSRGRIEHRFRAQDPADGFLYGFSGPHGQRLCSTSANVLLENWFSTSDCTEFCVDINLFIDGDGSPNQSSPFKPHFIVKGAGKSATFTWSNSLVDNQETGSGWTRFCAPVSKRVTGDPLPVSSDGSWTFSGTETEWNALFANVDQVILPIDSVLDVYEEVGYDNICVRGVSCPNEEDLSILKKCEPIDASTGAPWTLQCEIEVTATNPSKQIEISDALSGGLIATSEIVSADPWACSGLSCTISNTDFPTSGSSVLEVTLTLDELGEAMENCAQTVGMAAAPDGGELSSCVEIEITGDLPLEPKICEAFTPSVECNDAGGYQVVLSNSLTGSFDPTSIDVTVLTSGVTAQSNPNDPLTLILSGAGAGDTVNMSLASIEHGAGSKPGLDLCCMGELEVKIPEGLVCEPPEVHFDLTKTCEPNEQNDISNTICHIDVTYSGPPPTSSNPLTIADSQVSGTPIQVQAQWEPLGSAHYWECGLATGTPPFAIPPSCHIYDGMTQGAAHDWSSFQSTLTFFLDTDGPYKNCAAGEITLADGSVLQAEDCHTEGGSDLIIAKSATFDQCAPGQTCQFEYTVTNVGSGDYSDTITLLETTLTPSGGTINAISPALCTNASDLLAGGCTGHADIAAGSSITYIVDYVAPTGLTLPENVDVIVGENCVSLDDSTLSEFDELSEENGQLACTEFEIGTPELEIEKVANGACTPAAPCSFSINISTTGQPFTGRLAVVEQMIGQGATLTSITSTPPQTPACTPTSAFEGCVVDVALGANETFTLDVSATISGYLRDDAAHHNNHNCISVGLVSNSAPLGSFDPSANPAPPWASSWVPVHDDAICIPFDPPREPSEVDLTLNKEITTKTAPSDMNLPAGELPVFMLTPSVASGTLTPGAVITVSEDLAAYNMTYVYSTAPGWTCSETNDILTCSYTVPSNGAAPGPIEVGAQHLAVPWEKNCADVSISGQTDTNLSNNSSCITREDQVDEFDLAIEKTSDMELSPTGDIQFTLTPTVVTGTLMAGQVVEISDPIQGQGLGLAQVLPASGWVCDTSVTCQFTVASNGQTLPPITLSTSVPVGAAWQNCAKIRAMANGQDVAETDLDNNESCIAAAAQATPDIAATKTCDALQVSPGAPSTLTCEITVTGTNLTAGSGSVRVFDELSSQASANGTEAKPVTTFMANANVTSSENWSCTDTSSSAPYSAGHCDLPINDLIAAGGTSVLTVTAQIHNGGGLVADLSNCTFAAPHSALSSPSAQHCVNIGAECADGFVENAGSCVTGPPVGPEATLALTKSCEALGSSTAPGGRFCKISISAENLTPGQTLTVSENMLSGGSEHPSLVSVFAAQSAGWTCTQPVYSAANAPECSIATDELISQGGTATLLANVQVSQEFLEGTEPQNCVSGTIDGAAVGDAGCVAFAAATPPPPATPLLEAFKSAKGECEVNKAAQTYTCAFEIGVKNVGDGGYSGPLVLDDTFGAPKPKLVEMLDGDGWECLRTDGLGTSCLNGAVELAPGAASQVAMEVVIPGLASGGTFENCVGVGIGDSKFLRASVMQSIMLKLGIDGGPVDGAPGRKTRAGVRALQEQLGLEPTGEIDDETFEALGVPSTEGTKPFCISVELPPMPVPDVKCKPGQKKNSRGVCYWPEVDCPSGQVKNSKGQCYTPRKACPEGQRRNSKGQCYTVQKSCPSGYKLNSNGDCYKPRTQCNARSTIQHGDGCACRYRGMRKVSATRCVCQNTGLPPISGAGCPRIEIDRGEDGAGGHGKNCVIVNGQRICI